MGAADAPHAADEAVGAAAVERKPVVEVESDLQSLCRRRRPLQNLLSPVHPRGREGGREWRRGRREEERMRGGEGRVGGEGGVWGTRESAYGGE